MKCLSEYGQWLKVCKSSYEAVASLAGLELPWDHPARELNLDPDEIHIWCACLDQPVSCLDELRSLLSKDEIARARRFHFVKDAERFVARRGLLKMILGHYTGVEPTQLRFDCGAFGKPSLSFPFGTGLHFNASDSHEMALFAVSLDVAVGVDVEKVRCVPEADSIAARYFSTQEMADWRSVSSSERPRAFLKTWTRKEACLKAAGCGLRGLRPRALVETGSEVSLRVGGRPSPLPSPPGEGESSRARPEAADVIRGGGSVGEGNNSLRIGGSPSPPPPSDFNAASRPSPPGEGELSDGRGTMPEAFETAADCPVGDLVPEPGYVGALAFAAHTG